MTSSGRVVLECCIGPGPMASVVELIPGLDSRQKKGKNGNECSMLVLATVVGWYCSQDQAHSEYSPYEH